MVSALPTGSHPMQVDVRQSKMHAPQNAPLKEHHNSKHELFHRLDLDLLLRLVLRSDELSLPVTESVLHSFTRQTGSTHLRRCNPSSSTSCRNRSCFCRPSDPFVSSTPRIKQGHQGSQPPIRPCLFRWTSSPPPLRFLLVSGQTMFFHLFSLLARFDDAVPHRLLPLQSAVFVADPNRRWPTIHRSTP